MKHKILKGLPGYIDVDVSPGWGIKSQGPWFQNKGSAIQDTDEKKLLHPDSSESLEFSKQVDRGGSEAEYIQDTDQ